MTLKEFIYQYCKKHNTNISTIAQHADISRSSLYNMMEDGKSPTLVNIIKLATALQVHPQYLVKLEWQKFQTLENSAYPIDPLVEPKLWFYEYQDCSHFISETLPDGSIVKTGEKFTKTWRIQNTGEVTWRERKLQCQNTDLMTLEQLAPLASKQSLQITTTTPTVDISLTYPGESVDICVDFIAPNAPASVFSYWKMIDHTGQVCYPNSLGVYLLIHVISADSAHI